MLTGVYSFADAAARVSAQNPVSVEFDEAHTTLLVYAPHPVDQQTPHNRDELYVVARGSARFLSATTDKAIGAGDAIFVPKMEAHSFAEPSQDFAVWAFFYPS